MAQETTDPIRLPGSYTGSFGVVFANRNRLSLGPDYLLYVLNQRFTEEYKRLYYKNIQAIVTHTTKVGRVFNFIWGYLAANSLVLVLLSFLLGWHISLAVIFGALTPLFALFLLINWLQGPTCRTDLQTAVQTVRLYSLNRLPLAVKATAMIRERVEAVQGKAEDITPAQPPEAVPVAAEAGDLPGAAPAAAALPVAPQALAWKAIPPPSSADLKHDHGRAHEIFCLFLLADLCHSCIRVFAGGTWMYVSAIVLLVGLLSSLITAIIRQHGTDLPRSIKTMAWWTLGYLVVLNMVNSVYGIVYSVKHPELAGDTTRLSRALFDISPMESPFRLVELLVSIAFSGIIGFFGLWRLNLFRRASSAPPPLQAPPAAPPPPAPPGQPGAE